MKIPLSSKKAYLLRQIHSKLRLLYHNAYSFSIIWNTFCKTAALQHSPNRESVNRKGHLTMNMSNEQYKKYAKEKAEKSPILKDCIKAFFIGGLICVIAQGFFALYQHLGASEEDTRIWTTCTIIFITALLTGIGIFDRIGKHAGAGTIVPITGFANSVVSEAIDAKAEGWILGIGAKMFTIAGPVILYGRPSGTIYGFIYGIIQTARSE